MGLTPSGLPSYADEDWGPNGSIDFNVHSFIVKVWLEQDSNIDGESTWRGHITHVPGGEDLYLRNLGEIAAFIEPYLKKMGIRFRRTDRIMRWLRIRM